MEQLDFANIVGVIGAIGYLASYGILQFKREFAKSFAYSFMNFTAASFVAVSLISSFNLSAMIIQVAWILISAYGMYRCLKYKVEDNPELVKKIVALAEKPATDP